MGICSLYIIFNLVCFVTSIYALGYIHFFQIACKIPLFFLYFYFFVMNRKYNRYEMYHPLIGVLQAIRKKSEVNNVECRLESLPYTRIASSLVVS